MLYVVRDNWLMHCHHLRNESEDDQHRLQALRNCIQVDAIHWIYENFNQLQSRIAYRQQVGFFNSSLIKPAEYVRLMAESVAEQFITYNKTSGIYRLHPNYPTIAKMEMTRGKLKGRLERDKTSDEPKLKWNMSPQDFMTIIFMTPPPATLDAYISSVNNRGGTPVTVELTLVNVRPNIGSIRWEQKVGSIWDAIAGATGTSYTPPDTQDITIRAVATGYLDLEGDVIADTPSNELSIQR